MQRHYIRQSLDQKHGASLVTVRAFLLPLQCNAAGERPQLFVDTTFIRYHVEEDGAGTPLYDAAPEMKESDREDSIHQVLSWRATVTSRGAIARERGRRLQEHQKGRRGHPSLRQMPTSDAVPSLVPGPIGAGGCRQAVRQASLSRARQSASPCAALEASRAKRMTGETVCLFLSSRRPTH